MIPSLEPYQKSEYTSRILKVGIDGLKGIELFQAKELQEMYVKSIQKDEQFIMELTISNPNYNYPKGFIEDHYGYWKRKSDSYFKNKYCLDIVTTYINQNLANLNEKDTEPNQSSKLNINEGFKDSQETFKFTNNFDDVEEDLVFNHFNTNLVEKGYLSKDDLKDYLMAAFENKAIPKSKFRLKNVQSKQKIYTIFYIFYKDIVGKRRGQANEYIELLSKYFVGYDHETIRTNWSK